MTNDEIKELLRELAAKADADGEVKSQTIRINFSKPAQPSREKKNEDSSEEEQPERTVSNRESSRKTKASIPPEDSGETADDTGDFDDTGDDDSDTEVYRDLSEPKGEEESAKKQKRKGKAADVFRKLREKHAAWRETRKTRREVEEGLSDQPIDQLQEPLARKLKAERTEETGFDSDAADFLNTDSERAADEAALRKTRGKVTQKGNQLLQSMNQKGIGKRELIMIACGAVLLVLILFIVMSVLSNRRKSALVTADEGLHITVEREPSSWCRSGTATLKIRTESPMQTVTVNDAPTDISGETTSTMVTVEADTQELKVDVVTEEDVKHASVELKKVDCEDPQILVSSEDGKITLEVTDNKSGVAGVWYGIKEPTIEVAAYVPYTEPFEPEEGKIYGYFATDHAGNVTDPVITNLTPASAITLEEDTISLFPGESAPLHIITEPQNAFTNELVMESSDPAVAQVDERGMVTAIADGEADITVTAKDLPPVSGHVTVRSEVSFTISAVGDITLGEDVNFSPLNSFSTVQTMYGNSYFFNNVREIFEADDVTFGNFEGTLTTSSTRVEKQYAFRGDPSYTEILKDGSVDAVTLANNHSSDYGESSLTDTQKYLDEAGIEWCCGDKISLRDYNGVKVALIGIYVLDEGQAKAAQVESTIAEAKAAGAQLIVVAFHWGNERETKPDQTQVYLAHLAVDNGADLVVGHHPHVLQGIEKYSGKYICYSLANFCFGGNSNPSDMDTMIFQQTFEAERGGEIRAGEAVVIPCLVSSDPSWNNYQPTPAVGEEKDRILSRINELCQPFGTSF